MGSHLRYTGRMEASDAPGTMATSKTPVSPAHAKQDRAMDFWRLGEQCRIKNFIEPFTIRNLSLHAEVDKGFWNLDWQNVEPSQKQRSRFPALRRHVAIDVGPHPVGLTSEEIRRNRNFDCSHGTSQM